MSGKLEPTQAQRKAMALALARRVGRESFAQGDLDVVYHQIEAANSVPEGAPVGTIARRPDGKWKAERFKNPVGGAYWHYTISAAYTGGDMPPIGDAADSWPVIYDPRESGRRAVPAETRSEQRKSEEVDADPTAQQEPEGDGDLCEDCRRWRTDPTAQQEPETFSDAWIRQEFDKAEKRSAQIPDRAKPKVVKPQVEDNFPEFPESSTKPPRIPRVRDRLGVDEQGARWRSAGSIVHFHNGESWRSEHGAVFAAGYEPNWDAPYTEILD